MTDRVLDRATLRDWVLNDGWEHLFEEGYLDYKQVPLSDPVLRSSVAVAGRLWKAFQKARDQLDELIFPDEE